MNTSPWDGLPQWSARLVNGMRCVPHVTLLPTQSRGSVLPFSVTWLIRHKFGSLTRCASASCWFTSLQMKIYIEARRFERHWRPGSGADRHFCDGQEDGAEKIAFCDNRKDLAWAA